MPLTAKGAENRPPTACGSTCAHYITKDYFCERVFCKAQINLLQRKETVLYTR